ELRMAWKRPRHGAQLHYGISLSLLDDKASTSGVPVGARAIALAPEGRSVALMLAATAGLSAQGRRAEIEAGVINPAITLERYPANPIATRRWITPFFAFATSSR